MGTEANLKLRQMFDAAVVLPPESRAEFLRLACAGDDSLHRQLLDLLAAHQSSAEFLKATRATESVVLDGTNLRTSVGPYRLLREVGQGGMGTVYQAVRADDTFRKVVAIKILRADMAHPDFERRFRQERQILAALDHPNIARIIDGGATPEGLPYYVMDFVEGLPINPPLRQPSLEPGFPIAAAAPGLRRGAIPARQPDHPSRPEAEQHPGHR